MAFLSEQEGKCWWGTRHSNFRIENGDIGQAELFYVQWSHDQQTWRYDEVQKSHGK